MKAVWLRIHQFNGRAARTKSSLIDSRFFIFYCCFCRPTTSTTHTRPLPPPPDRFAPSLDLPTLAWLHHALSHLSCVSPSHTHTHFPTHSAHFTHADVISSPPLLGSPLSLRKMAVTEPREREASPRPQTKSKEWERGSKRITAAILADGGSRGRERWGRGKDEGRMGGPRCEHRPTEHSPTCGVN